jgi:hypothetical protein
VLLSRAAAYWVGGRTAAVPLLAKDQEHPRLATACKAQCNDSSVPAANNMCKSHV